ncbi:anthranilate synthase component I family protein [Sporosarcina sp. JAI121]|uniref:anthranilate synthase component I family protein n=1 Tax=Sporosarcina sp. JAI121 TaxID=2723064 RepID=UPI0017D996E5|nr:chorismate-binding protein [Sporosarcina sp. JAI121]NYF25596.1 anthranilate synthase component 1 [Sporosarcina sp. JAI121]
MSIEKMSLRTTMKKVNGDSLTPILIFRRMQGERKFLLESSSKHEGSGRYSFIGMDPLKSYYGRDGKLEEHVYATGKKYVHEGNLFVLLKRLMPRITDDIGFPFTGGAVGYVAYGAGSESTSRSGDDMGFPDVNFNIYETIVIFDHVLNEVTLLHTEISPEQSVPDLDVLAESMLSGPEKKDMTFEISDYTCPVTQQQFEELVRKAKGYIEQGEAEQIVLSRRLVADFNGDPFSLYRKLRKRNPSPYMYYMEFADHIVVGTSPESLVRVSEGKVMTNPIAGTRRRGADKAEDVALEKELLADPKEIAEHDMLVELGRKDMEKVCVPDSVHVTSYMEVVRYEHVMHLVSEAEGTLSPVLHALDALTACLPAGTVTGTPKKRAMELIDELEKMDRGIYGGAIGYIGFNGNMDFALTIRTMIVKDGKAYVQAGAGIVQASDPTAEFMETVNKARSLLEVIN